MSELTPERVKEVLATMVDPILERGLVSHRFFNRAEVSGGRVTVHLDVPAHAYPQSGRNDLVERVVAALREAGASDVDVALEVATAWSPPPSEKALLDGTKNIIAVAAGKGGVGKSTVAVNLAMALQQQGAKVGLLDADVFGPSIPQMLGTPSEPAHATAEQKIVPAVHHGLKVISVGFFVDRDQPVIWRGPVVHKLLEQFLRDVEWGELDYLVCDLPPGTGDVQLSLSQLISIAGAVMVTTPQEVSVSDVMKGIGMFRETEIPLLGVIENMSFYLCPECGHRDEIFAHGGGRRLAESQGLPFLGEIGIDSRIRDGGDNGVPVVVAEPDSVHAATFLDIATQISLDIAVRILDAPKPPTRLKVLQ